MNNAELIQIIENLRFVGSDTQHVEVKAAKGGFPKSVIESVCAFANDGGGTIILGLDEDAGFKPVTIDAKRYANTLKTQCEQDLNLPLHPAIDCMRFENHTLVVVEVSSLQPKEKPCYITHRGGIYQSAYIRIADGDHRLSAYEVDRLLENRTQPKWDLEPVVEASLADLDEVLVDAILTIEKKNHPRIFSGSKVSVLRMLHILAPAADSTSDREDQAVPTLGGLLALGTYPQYFFPQLTVTCVAYPGSDKSGDGRGARFLDNAHLIGSIPQLVADAVAFVAKNMRIGTTIKNGKRIDIPDYPLDVVREAVTNALMHRDYSPGARGAQVQVNLFVDRLEVQSPGGLFGTVTLERLGQDGISDSRNQYLADILERTPYEQIGHVAENRGSGYQNMLSELLAAKMPPPKPKETLNYFRLQILQRNQNQSKEEGKADVSRPARSAIIEYLGMVPTASSRDLATAAGISLGGTRRILAELLREGIIDRTQPANSPKQRYRLAREKRASQR